MKVVNTEQRAKLSENGERIVHSFEEVLCFFITLVVFSTFGLPNLFQNNLGDNSNFGFHIIINSSCVLQDVRYHSSMKMLLECNEEELIEIDADFTVTEEHLGERVTVPLVPNGDRTPVNLKNREEFVQ